MDATFAHTPALVARQLVKYLQANLSTFLTVQQSTLFADDFADVTLDMPADDAFWIGPAGERVPEAAFYTPSIGVRYGSSQISEGFGDIIGSGPTWGVVSTFELIMGSAGPTPQLAIEVSQAYASAVLQCINLGFISAAQSGTETSASLGASIPVGDVRPVNVEAGILPDEDDPSADCVFGIVTISIAFKHK